MKKAAVGLDIGTTAVKAIVLDNLGGVLYANSLPHTLESPLPGYAEENPELWLTNIKNLLTDIASTVDRRQIGALGVSGMVPTLILVDEAGNPLHPSIQQNDARASTEIAEFKTEIDEDMFFNMTGNTINQQVVFPKYRWLAKHKPELIRKTRFIMGSYNYCGYRLTDTPTLDVNWALESGMWLLEKKEWHKEILTLCQIPESFLAPVHSPADIIGFTTRRLEEDTRFPSGIPVIAGSADHVASALSVGVQDEGDLLLKLGGAADILYATKHCRLDKRLFIDYHDIEDHYLLNGCMASSGSIVEWFVRQLGKASLSELDRAAEGVKPGCHGLLLLPYFLGEKTPIFDLNARGVYFGLSLFHEKQHMYRAILESVAYGFLHHIEVIREMQLEINRVFLSNGGSKSSLWRQIVVDAVGRDGLYYPDHPGSCLGVAFLAANGAGISNNWQGLKKYLTKAVKISFSSHNHQIYQAYFHLYKELYRAVKPLFEKLKSLESLGLT
ncbi:MAG: xylulose kinase [Spirochaetaceae bacterium]|nr:MAG: xylulose kinase [Spirochaetaceae bacterium]